MTLGEKLRARRKAQKRTLRQVAKEAGISVSYLCNLELMDNKSPSPAVCRRLAEALRVEPAELYELAAEGGRRG